MSDPASTSDKNVDDRDRRFGPGWPRLPRSPRLAVITIIGGLTLIVLGALAFWQINHVFSLIDAQRQRQRSVSEALAKISELDSLLTKNNSDAINAIHAIDERSSTADIADLQAQQVKNRQDLAQGLRELQLTLSGYGQSDYLQRVESMRLMIDELARSREQMVATYKEDRNFQTYMQNRDLMQARRVSVTAYMFHIRTEMQPELDESQREIDKVLHEAFLVSCGTLGISGIFIFGLGWMLIRYMDKRDQVESQLRRLSEMLQQTTEVRTGVINALEQGVAVFGYDHKLVLWNPRFAELHGIKADVLHTDMSTSELRRMAVVRRDYSPEYAEPRFDEHIAKVRQGESSEVELYRSDGMVVQLKFHPMSDQYFVLTLMDLTEIRRAEQLARDQAVRLGTIMNNVPDAIVTINSSGSIESWNAGAERMFGYEASEVIHRNVSVLMTEPHASEHDHYLRRFLMQGDRATLNRLRELTARRHDGTEFPIDLRVSEMELGEKRMFTGIIRDITERRAVEQMKNEFISTVSHELRTPLTSIIGSLTLLVDGVAGSLSDKAKRLIVMAEKNSQRLGRLINDILDLEKAEAGRMSLRLDVVKLLPMLQHSLELNQSYAAQFAVELRLSAPVESVLVRADEVRLLQVMSNLLSNAIKSSPGHSQVLVEVQPNTERVRVTVHDEGPGIAEEFKERVFQRFAQADSSDARRAAGTGLGLAITKQLVELHGGRIGFNTGRSLVGNGQGASFWFELPRVIHTVPLAMGTGAEPLNMNVVLCEDDPDIAEVLIEMLHLEGCSVRHTGVSSGVRALLNSEVSVLIMDVDLPDQNGLSLVTELRREGRWHELPVLVVSGTRLSHEERARHEALQIRAWLDKPVDRSTLRAALSQSRS